MINLISDTSSADLKTLLDSGLGQQLMASEQPQIIQMQPGVNYVLARTSEGKNELLQDLVAVRKGDDLIVYHADGSEIVFQDYYLFCGQSESEGRAENNDEACSVTVAGKDGTEHVFKADAIDNADVDNASIVYTSGDQSTLQAIEIPALMVTAESEPDMEASSSGDETESGSVFGSAMAILGAAVFGASSGSSSISANTDAPESSASRVYNATISLGPMTDAGDGTEVTLFKADGTVLGSMTASRDGTGTFSYTDTTGYTGVVIARVVDTDDSDDYMDEATSSGQDISATLYAVLDILESNTNIGISITPLSTIAAQKMGISDTGPSVTVDANAEEVMATNMAVAQAFGLGDDVDLARAQVDTTISPDGVHMSNSNEYGQALALISALEQTTQDNDPNVTQENATQTVINNLVAALTVDDSAASLSDDMQQSIIESASQVDMGAGDATRLLQGSSVTNEAPSGSITIAGAVAQGETLRATHNISDTDGIPADSYRYKWQANNIDIEGANEQSYRLTQDEVGKTITFVASYTDEDGVQEIVKSDATAEIANIDDAGSIAAIGGTATQGQTLTAGEITDIDGGVTGQTYVWMRGSDAITAATASTYTLSQADVGEQISVVVTYTDGHGAGKTVTSAATEAVANIDDAGEVSITGTVLAGQELMATVTDIDGDVNNISYQWYADGVMITGALAQTFMLTEDQDGARITVTANYTDAFGPNRIATSQPVSDQTVPSVTEVTITGLDGNDAVTTDTLVAGDKVKVVVQMSEPVFLSGDGGNPSYTINLGDSNKTATYVSGLGSNTLVFTYTITANDIDLSGGVSAGSEALNLPDGSALQDPAENDANLTTPAPSTNTVSVDAVSPVFITTQLTANENTTVVGTVEVTDDSAITDYQLAGDDADLFSITDAGVLAFRAAQNYESPSDMGNDGEYNITVIATDAAGNNTSQTVTVQLQNVNETPTLTSEIEDTTATVNLSFTLDISRNFSDPDSGDTLTYSATGLPDGFSISSDGEITGNATAAIAARDIVVTATDGSGLTVTDTFSFQATAAPTVSSSLQGETNIDVRSPIVLTFSENVNARTGNIIIKDLNENGVGWRLDVADNTQTIDVTDTDLVTIVDNVVTINAPFDLDFATNYEITFNAGTFVGAISGQPVAAMVEDELTFTTVTPAENAVGNLSSIQEAGVDALVESNYWIDAHQSNPTAAAINVDASEHDVAIAVSTDLLGDTTNTYDFVPTVREDGHISLTGDTNLNDILYQDLHNSWDFSQTTSPRTGWSGNSKTLGNNGRDGSGFGVKVTFNDLTDFIYADTILVDSNAGTVITG